MEPIDAKHVYWMKRALSLARRSLGRTHPNPLVGAIILSRRGEKVGEGFHEKAGQPHAEVLALGRAGEKAGGGTLYCTLEPCNHVGRVGPCTQAILRAGIKHVVIASQDVNPLVSGQGVKCLTDAGLDVTTGVLSEQEAALNAPFRQWIQTGKPLVTVKLALSADGYIGVSGQRLMLSSRETHGTTMKLRAEAQAIIVGVRTALTDDPLLTVRDSRYPERYPLKIILDPNLKIKPGLHLFKKPDQVMVVCNTLLEGSAKADELKAMGMEVLGLPTDLSGKLQLINLMTYLGQREMTAVLVEGGAATVEEFSRQGLVDRWVIYQTSHKLGDRYDKGLW